MDTSTQRSCVLPDAGEALGSRGRLVRAGGAPTTISGSIVRSSARAGTAAIIETAIAKIAAFIFEAPRVAGLPLDMVIGDIDINSGLSPSPHLHHKSDEPRVERGKVDPPRPRPAEALAPAAPAAPWRLTEGRNGNPAGDPEAAGCELGAHGKAIIDGEEGESCFAVAGPVFHDGGTQIAAGKAPSLCEIAHTIMNIGVRHRKIGKGSAETEHARG